MSNSFKELLHKYNSGVCTPEEKAIIEAWYQQMEAPGVQPLTDAQLNEIDALEPNLESPAKVKRLSVWLSVAAAILVVAVAAVYFMRRPAITIQQQVVKLHDDVLPGSNKAILTLANGSKVVLNTAQNGTIAQQGDIVIQKDNDGKLSYQSTNEHDTKESAAPMFNTITTPRGGQYHLILDDGTNVWLNAASSIKYPTTFNGNERRVEISGEVYFEVTHNPQKPFKVMSGTQVVEVLGTHFNINAYADEPSVTTTLLQGSVRVTAHTSPVAAVLEPGQQSILSDDNHIKVKVADTEAAVDWKEGDFVFRNQTLPDIMRKVSRWYNVDVNYGSYSNSKLTFSGVVSRSRNLSAVLKMLELTGAVKFAVKDNVVTIVNHKNDKN